MQPERSLVPYEVCELNSEPLLVFAPHPDDEIFGMGGTLLLAKQKSLPIKIIYVTLGQKGGEEAVRKREAIACCEKLGAEYQFLDYVDREISVEIKEIAHFKEILLEHKEYHVYFPSPLEYHPDHRAVAALVWRAAQEAGHKKTLFSYEISRQSEVNQLRDISSVQGELEDLMACYESQLRENNYIEIVNALNKSRTYTLPKEVEFAEGFCKFEHGWGFLKNRFRELQHRPFDNVLPTDRPLISVLIRTQNRREFLVRALESVKKQAYKGNIEVVVVNDGGELVDDITDSFLLDFRGLTVVNLPHKMGRSAAANIALTNCKGSFVNFLDDDDEFKENHVAVFLHHWRRDNSIEVLYRGVDVLSKTGDFVRAYNDAFDAGRLMQENYIPIHAVTFSRKFIEMGCRFDETLEYLEDWDFWIQLSRLSSFFHSPTITSIYHLVGSSVASPHMQKIIDPISHRNRVLEKWSDRWTTVERNRMVQSMIRRAKSL